MNSSLERMMPHIERPDGARIYYEVQGAGYPLLLFAPGAINSQVSFWGISAISPYDFADEYLIIGMDQRHAEQSPAPLEAPTWEVHALDPAAYERIIRAYDEQLWGAHGAYMSVEESFVRECPVPLLVLPGTDAFHPTALAQRLCREAPRATCLAPDCRSPEKIEATKETIRRFLREHTPRA